MTAYEVKWEAPSKTKNNHGRNRQLAAALRSRPGEWALVYESASKGLLSIIKKGRYPAWEPAGSFQAVSRQREDGKADIYARYVGVPDLGV